MEVKRQIVYRGLNQSACFNLRTIKVGKFYPERVSTGVKSTTGGIKRLTSPVF